MIGDCSTTEIELWRCTISDSKSDSDQIDPPTPERRRKNKKKENSNQIRLKNWSEPDWIGSRSDR